MEIRKKKMRIYKVMKKKKTLSIRRWTRSKNYAVLSKANAKRFCLGENEMVLLEQQMSPHFPFILSHTISFILSSLHPPPQKEEKTEKEKVKNRKK